MEGGPVLSSKEKEYKKNQKYNIHSLCFEVCVPEKKETPFFDDYRGNTCCAFPPFIPVSARGRNNFKEALKRGAAGLELLLIALPSFVSFP